MRPLPVGVVLLLTACACGEPRTLPGAPPPALSAEPVLAAPPDARPAAVVDAPLPCPEPEAPPPTTGGTQSRALATFADLPGWADDQHAAALPALLASCAVLARRPDGDPVGYDGKSGTIRQWRAACAEAARLPVGDDAAARAFFERAFRPWSIQGATGAVGKATGYCVQPLRASRTRHGRYQWPLYARPPDLVEVFLSDFISDGRGRRIWGQVDRATGHLRRYPTRGELRTSGALAGNELVYVDDPVDAIYAQIEGSARATLEDGSVIWLNFDGKNGRGYKGVGKILKEGGHLRPGHGSMHDIRAWFAANPGRADELLDQNSSMVFFAISAPGATGSQGVVLTDGRSVAVDRSLIAHTTPVWVDTTANGKPWQKLTIAQDTGGAILGAVRVDIYLGHDEAAVELCGRLNFPARTWLLLPRGVRGD